MKPDVGFPAPAPVSNIKINGYHFRKFKISQKIHFTVKKLVFWGSSRVREKATIHHPARPLQYIINFPESINNQSGHLLPLAWFIFGAGDSRAVMNTKSARGRN